jgi:hypothetical protein
MKKQTRKIAVLSVLAFAVIMLTGCRSMFGKKDQQPKYVSYDFPKTGEVGPDYKINNKNNPVQVIMFAKSLSRAGRYNDSSGIFLDAADRFNSKSGRFEFDCKTAAVRELWLDGNLKGAAKQLNELEMHDDIYLKASEVKSIRKLRRLLKESNVIKANANLSKDNTAIEIGG